MFRSHRFNELTGARYAAGASLSPSKPFRPQNPQVGDPKSQVPNSKANRTWNLIFLKGYVKELLRLKSKQIRMSCQGFVIFGLSGFRSYSGKLGDDFNVNSGNVDVFNCQTS